jgi:hypothetical protein
MSDIGPIFGPLDIAVLAFIIGRRGLPSAWRQFRWSGGDIAPPARAVGRAPLLIWFVGFVLREVSPWDCNGKF